MTSSRDSARVGCIFGDAIILTLELLEDITTLWEFISKQEQMEVEMRGDNLFQIVNQLPE